MIPVKIFCRQSSHVGFSEDDIKRVAYKSFSAKEPLKADINFFSSFHKDVSQDIRPLQSLSSELRPLKKMEFTKKGRQIKWSVDEEGKPSKSFTSSSHNFYFPLSVLPYDTQFVLVNQACRCMWISLAH